MAMKTLFGKRPHPDPWRWPVMTLGVFDGVHIGHQKVLRETVAWARRMNGEAVVLTFDRHPESVISEGEPLAPQGAVGSPRSAGAPLRSEGEPLAPQGAVGSPRSAGAPLRSPKGPLMITGLRHRLLLFESFGVDVCIVLKFDAAMAATPAQDFVREIMHDWLKVRGVIWGFDCRFGRAGQGDLRLLEQLAPTYGFQVCSVEPVLLDGAAVKSTAIRQAIVKGELEAAARMLGRPYSLLGTVVHGDHRGRSLGFPTANLDLHHEVRPPRGIYSCRVILNGTPHRALTSVGVRPTFEKTAAPREVVEVYIIGFDGNLYGQDLDVRFVRRLRDERKFPSADALIQQMQRDKEQVMREDGE